MAALVTLLNVALRLLADDSRLEAATTLLGTESSSDSDPKRNYGGHDSFESVSILLHCTSR
jgi:hypothetical protein